MFYDDLLKELKEKERKQFCRKQAAWNRLQEAKKNTKNVYDEKQEAYEELARKREEMNRRFEIMASAREESNRVWGEYRRIAEELSSKKSELIKESNKEHAEMQECFRKAKDDYRQGGNVHHFLELGREHKEARNKINREVKKLSEMLVEEKEKALKTAPEVDFPAYQEAREEYESAKERFNLLNEVFKKLNATKEEFGHDFTREQKEYLRIKEEYKNTAEEYKKALHDRRKNMIIVISQ